MSRSRFCTGLVLVLALVGAQAAVRAQSRAVSAAVAAATVLRPPVTPPVFSHPLVFTNRNFPFVPGGTKVFTGLDGRNATTSVDFYHGETRTFSLGGVDIPTRILQETEFENGKLKEISQNYFAQADDGTVYYFGEVVDNYEDGVIADHEGSWLVGGPTQPGDPEKSGNAPVPAVFMPAEPEVGESFKPEDLFPIVDETATVVATNRRIAVPAGRFSNVLEIRETSRLSSGSETKYYAAGQGVISGKSRSDSFKLIASTF